MIVFIQSAHFMLEKIEKNLIILFCFKIIKILCKCYIKYHFEKVQRKNRIQKRELKKSKIQISVTMILNLFDKSWSVHLLVNLVTLVGSMFRNLKLNDLIYFLYC